MANKKNAKFQKNDLIKTCFIELKACGPNQYGIVLGVSRYVGKFIYTVYLQSGEKTNLLERWLKKA
jgi:hypothetical protein